MSEAFRKCEKLVSVYQDHLLSRLADMENSSASKNEQQRIHTMASSLSGKRDEATAIACTKQLIAVLKLGGSQTGFFADEFAVLNGKMVNHQIDLKNTAILRTDDLTAQGWAQASQGLSMALVDPNQLQAEIDAALQSPSGAGYFACLMPSEWVAWFSSNSFCHGDSLEGGLAGAASLIASKR